MLSILWMPRLLRLLRLLRSLCLFWSARLLRPRLRLLLRLLPDLLRRSLLDLLLRNACGRCFSIRLQYFGAPEFGFRASECRPMPLLLLLFLLFLLLSLLPLLLSPLALLLLGETTARGTRG